MGLKTVMQVIYLLVFASPFQEEQRQRSFLWDHAGEHARALVHLYFIHASRLNYRLIATLQYWIAAKQNYKIRSLSLFSGSTRNRSILKFLSLLLLLKCYYKIWKASTAEVSFVNIVVGCLHNLMIYCRLSDFFHWELKSFILHFLLT